MLSGGSAKRTARQRSMTILQKAAQAEEALRCAHPMADHKLTLGMPMQTVRAISVSIFSVDAVVLPQGHQPRQQRGLRPLS
jgi:hypothetical protein